MAKGRFLSKQITIDKKVNDLKDPWSMLGFTWMIPHADCEGRLYGDPAVLKSFIFPRQNGNISAEYMEELAISWQNAGLIIYYEDENDRYIQLINFEKHQSGLRKDREPESTIPGFNPDNCRIIDGKKRVKLSKVKLSEVNIPEKSSGDAPSKEPQKPPKKEADHPAILAFRKVVNRYPNKALFNKVIEVLGDKPDIPKIKTCYEEWLSRGYNANSINWLDWYTNGIPTYKKGPPTPAPKIYKDADGNLVEV